VSFAAITLCVDSQQGFIVVSVYFVMDSVRKLLNAICKRISCIKWPCRITSVVT
jgi:uncharacterized membrane protein